VVRVLIDEREESDAIEQAEPGRSNKWPNPCGSSAAQRPASGKLIGVVRICAGGVLKMICLVEGTCKRSFRTDLTGSTGSGIDSGISEGGGNSIDGRATSAVCRLKILGSCSVPAKIFI
jgi:hypothetical protein